MKNWQRWLIAIASLIVTCLIVTLISLAMRIQLGGIPTALFFTPAVLVFVWAKKSSRSRTYDIDEESSGDYESPSDDTPAESAPDSEASADTPDAGEAFVPPTEQEELLECTSSEIVPVLVPQKTKKSLAKRIIIASGCVLVAGGLIAGGIIAAPYIIEQIELNKLKDKYSSAAQLLQENKFDDAVAAFQEIIDYEDAGEQINEAKYLKAKAFIQSGDYASANTIFKEIPSYKDSEALIHEAHSYVTKEEVPFTCTTDGYYVKECSVCGVREQVTTKARHYFSDATCTKPETCIVCGLTEGEPLNHSTGKAICLYCGAFLFQPVTYSGYGPGTVKDIKLPEGSYTISGAFSGDSAFTAYFNWYGRPEFLSEKISSQTDSSHTLGLIKTPAERTGYIEVTEAEGSWIFAIRAYG